MRALYRFTPRVSPYSYPCAQLGAEALRSRLAESGTCEAVRCDGDELEVLMERPSEETALSDLTRVLASLGFYTAEVMIRRLLSRAAVMAAAGLLSTLGFGSLSRSPIVGAVAGVLGALAAAKAMREIDVQIASYRATPVPGTDSWQLTALWDRSSDAAAD